MKLKNIVAEWLYYTDANRNPAYTFPKQNSNVKDYYCRVAHDKIPQLLSGYFGIKFEKVVLGLIRDTINQHGEITMENATSAAKRITRQLAHFKFNSKHYDIVAETAKRYDISLEEAATRLVENNKELMESLDRAKERAKTYKRD